MNREDQIDNYILDRMTAEEKASFELEMSIDSQLKKDVEIMLNAKAAIRSIALKEIFTDKEKSIKRTRYITVCITIVIAIVTAWISLSLMLSSDNNTSITSEKEVVSEPAIAAKENTTAIVEPSSQEQTTCQTSHEQTANDAGNTALPHSSESKHVTTRQTETKVEVTIEKSEKEVTQEEFDIQKDEMQIWKDAAEAINEQDWDKAKILLKKVIELNGQHKQQAQDLLAEIEFNIP